MKNKKIFTALIIVFSILFVSGCSNKVLNPEITVSEQYRGVWKEDRGSRYYSIRQSGEIYDKNNNKLKILSFDGNNTYRCQDQYGYKPTFTFNNNESMTYTGDSTFNCTKYNELTLNTSSEYKSEPLKELNGKSYIISVYKDWSIQEITIYFYTEGASEEEKIELSYKLIDLHQIYIDNNWKDLYSYLMSGHNGLIQLELSGLEYNPLKPHTIDVKFIENSQLSSLMGKTIQFTYNQ